MTQRSAIGDLRLGIVGTGAMAGQMARAASLVEGVTVSAVLSRDKIRAEQFCRDYSDGASACNEILHLFDLVDAIYVATPPVSHRQFVAMAIEARKHVLCEKPLTISAEETDNLLDRARDAQVLLMEAIWTLALPAYKKLKRVFTGRENALLRFDFSYPAGASGPSQLLDPQTGGVLIDRAVYGYAASITLLGEVVQQSVWITRDSDGLETKAEMVLEHAEGARSIISLSIDSIGSNLLEVSNASELIVLGPNSLAAETLRRIPCPDPARMSTIAEKPGLKSRLKAVPALRAMKARLPAKSQFFGYGKSSYAPILQEFVSTVRNNLVESDVVPHRLSKQVSHLLEDARKQGKEART